ncbi:MAG: hypothetical protein RH982_05040 [Parvibaculum sp.]
MKRAPLPHLGTILLALAVLVAPAAWGAAARAAETVGAAVGMPLQEAQVLMKSGKFVEALAKLRVADSVPEKTGYERFLIEDFRAYLHSRTGNHAAAAASAEAALATGHVPQAEQPRRLRMIASLYFQAKAYDKAIDYARRFQETAGADSGMQLLVAQSYYLLKDYDNAISEISALNGTVKQAGGTPEEAWLQLLMSSAYHAGRNDVRRAALMDLVRRYPSPAYWTDLLDLIATGLGGSDRMMLEVNRLRLAAGVLQSSQDFMEAAQLALMAGLPGEARAILEQGVAKGILGKTGDGREQRLLAAARAQAVEDSGTLPSSAGSPGEAAVLGEAYASYGDHAKAVSLYKSALAAKDGVDTDLARLHLAWSFLSLDDRKSARQTLAEISRNSPLADLAKALALLADRPVTF